MIELKTLHIKNFLSHSDSYLELYELEGLVLIEGINSDGRYDSNGSGKSTLLEGIVYALTGNTLRNVSVGDVVNRTAKKNTMSHLSLSKDSTILDIYRYRKDDEHGDSIIVEKNGKDVSARLNKDTQAVIDNELGIPYRVLTNTILLGEGLSSKFTQLSDPDKKSLIESTLSLSYDLGKSRDVISTRLKEIKLEVSRLSGSISTLENMVESSKDYMTEKEYQVSLDSTRAIQRELSEQLNQADQSLDILTNKLTVLNTARVEIESILQELNMLRQSEVQVDMKLQSLNVEAPHCELCGQSLKDEKAEESVRKSYLNSKEELTNKSREIVSRLSNYPPMETITESITRMSAERATVEQTRHDLQSRINKVIGDIYSIESDIKHIQSMENNIMKYRDQMESEKSQMSSLESNGKDYEYLNKLFSPTGIINYILEEAVLYINERLEVYTELLIDKSYHLGLSKGKLTLEDYSGASYQSLSNGEKRRLDICIQFSLHDYIHNYCGIKLDTLFIDEILDTLDRTGTENIIEVMRLKMEYCNLKRVLVITHNQDLKNKFDKIVTVSKDEKGNSKLI